MLITPPLVMRTLLLLVVSEALDTDTLYHATTFSFVLIFSSFYLEDTRYQYCEYPLLNTLTGLRRDGMVMAAGREEMIFSFVAFDFA